MGIWIVYKVLFKQSYEEEVANHACVLDEQTGEREGRILRAESVNESHRLDTYMCMQCRAEA